MKTLILICLFSNFLFSQLLPGGGSDRYESNKYSNNSSIAMLRAGVNGLKISENYGVEGEVDFTNVNKNKIVIGFGLNATLFSTFKTNEVYSDYIRYFSVYGSGGYFIKLNNNIHFIPNINLGFGRMNTATSSFGISRDVNGDFYFYIEPKLDLDFKIYKKNYLGVSTSYRIYTDIEKYNFSNSDFNGFIINLAYKLML